MEEPDGTDDNSGFKRDAQKGVGPAAVVLKGGDRSLDPPAFL